MKNKFTFPLLLVLLLISVPLLGQDMASREISRTVVRDGVSMGTALGVSLAVVTSWSRNQSILWAILHGILNWLYVIYFAITRDSRG